MCHYTGTLINRAIQSTAFIILQYIKNHSFKGRYIRTLKALHQISVLQMLLCMLNPSSAVFKIN